MRSNRRRIVLVTLGILAGLGIYMVATGSWKDAGSRSVEFTDLRRQTEEFHAYYRSIELNPDQEAVMREALSGIEAPCCGDHTAYTCCCPCNMAKSWWGLAKHLIAERGRDAEQVRRQVTEWIEFIGPNGFSGDACYTGGCIRPFHQNGCGGMDENAIIF